MSLTEKISNDLVIAMKSGDKVALEAIRAAKTAFLLAKSEKGQQELTSDEELKVIQKLVKQRRESAQIYSENNRQELAAKENAEADVLDNYLPAKMSPDELEKALKEIVLKTGAKTPADMGKVMGVATKELAGKADGREISTIVKQLLAEL
ncbi:MAG TPA: GatB/YqeY domain-containing protein [Bacteroidales bacterium]|nr:GatB/YqeY domain-containing protein [Bacteroidales bacterium]HPF03273.1 GatB/YqeY domain-containing protein [Bacteroidales bacterium]HPJ58752.1 GatB/YqeY domain-containing protein [Bacteroidales bacterium]HPR11902.1 GatB/YqeY domain-containing protein [Bacteroidales bacterium]HRW85399.1 GatB/YqeY domain-containing protein [Bacteroidales bacterium]